MSEKYKHIFGPIPSRRFGRSLGVDLTPGKTCSMNCIFCQLGATKTLTVDRKEYVPTAEVLDELRRWSESGGVADCVSLAGSGEPTLHSGFGDVLDFIRNEMGLTAILLSNGTTLHLPEVRKDAIKADIVKVSLSAWDQASFDKINRACNSVSFDSIVAGQKAFRNEYSGEMRLEVFVVAGINSDIEDMKKIAAIAADIQPDLVQLNTAVRPVAEPAAITADIDQLGRLAKVFDPPANIIASFSSAQSSHMTFSPESVLAAIRRHPSTAAEVAGSCGVSVEKAAKCLGELVDNGKAAADERELGTYYSSTL
jgi:wyosine [tRNA(Phe)-imidazoG37] synthetase (radical SAM superfamily)